MTQYIAPEEEPQLVGKKWDDKLARRLQDWLRQVRQLGNQPPGRHGKTHMSGGGDALPIDKLRLKGDLLTKTVDGYERLGVGADTFVLTADAAEATGIKWAASSGGGGGDSESAIALAMLVGD